MQVFFSSLPQICPEFLYSSPWKICEKFFFESRKRFFLGLRVDGQQQYGPDVPFDIASLELKPVAGLDVAALAAQMARLTPAAGPGPAPHNRHPVFAPRPSTATPAPKGQRARKTKGKR